ncbi:protein of unknown function [Thiomonas sp. Bio17B3]|nr:hypothetical protein ACO3_250133 [Thiomonas arsenitoxydans]CQR41626.1 hypothetical protein THICB3110195 [Thiomonas sp. CB3]VDY04059.1 protein of unknown function [Thiomonas sp. Bio17B3]VDY08769.1 protein of unknown function [Thiomonas sp. Sup16B3]VDY12306.1 conserved protein of unknown function [Thiomonas sp. OC7]VDY18479.1 protein of unknown function [Thiomonas sp. CB2]
MVTSFFDLDMPVTLFLPMFNSYLFNAKFNDQRSPR